MELRILEVSDALPYAALVLSGLTLVILVVEKLWGGGNALAEKFHKLERDTAATVTAVRTELNTKIDEFEDVSTVGFDAIKSNIHAMQLGLAEFRAKMSEDLHAYIRKDDYNAGIGDVKRDVQNGFRSVDERLGQLQDLIMYAGGEPPPRQTQHRKPG